MVPSLPNPRIVLAGALLMLAGCTGGYPQIAGPTGSDPSTGTTSPPEETTPYRWEPEYRSLVNATFAGFVRENLSGLPIHLSGRPCDDLEDAGRPNVFLLWNRTGRALYEEWPTKCGSWSNTTVAFPDDPPYAMRIGFTTAKARMTLPPARYWNTAMCFWYTSNCTREDPHYEGRSFSDWSSRNGTARVKAGELTGELLLRMPSAVDGWSAGPGPNDNPETHGGEKLELIDPAGRVNSWWNKSAFDSGPPVHYWGDVPMNGTWTFRMTLDLPALIDHTWEVTWQWYQHDPDVRLLGFEWPAEDFDPIDVVDSAGASEILSSA